MPVQATPRSALKLLILSFTCGLFFQGRVLRLIFLAFACGCYRAWTAACTSSRCFAAGRRGADLRYAILGAEPFEPKASSLLELQLPECEGFWKAVTVFNAACWGVSYISSKVGIDALAAAGVEDAPIVFGALRFGLAAVPLLPWLPRSSALESARASAIVGSLNGLSYAAVFSSYSYGTSGGKAAFIVSLQALVVAACTSLATKRLQVSTVVSAILAVVGVGFLELSGGPLETSFGDLLCSAAPLAVGIGWYILGNTMKKYPDDTLPSLAIQFTCFTVLFVTWTLVDVALTRGPSGIVDWLGQAPSMLQTPGLLAPLLFSTFLGNVLTMLLANRAVQFVKVSEVSLIVASEPLWAALAAVLYLGDVFTIGDCIGGGFIIAGLLCNELWEDEGDERKPVPGAAQRSCPRSDALAMPMRRPGARDLNVPQAGDC
ncbi:unnamed protein product [Symbiodinium natans]|uniref:EamA domain-containing protein n=1 Tax=Symbiodinium natans TaxID=878477 RepID=A0A812SNM9_9DINO|nr:unnamed protein product [Symbiodinium natans]